MSRRDDIIIDELKIALQKHIEAQNRYEQTQTATLESILTSHEEIKEFVKRADPVVTSFTNIANAGDIVSKFVMVIAKFTLALGAIVGAIYALKEWIKR